MYGQTAWKGRADFLKAEMMSVAVALHAVVILLVLFSTFSILCVFERIKNSSQP